MPGASKIIVTLAPLATSVGRLRSLLRRNSPARRARLASLPAASEALRTMPSFARITAMLFMVRSPSASTAPRAISWAGTTTSICSAGACAKALNATAQKAIASKKRMLMVSAHLGGDLQHLIRGRDDLGVHLIGALRL